MPTCPICKSEAKLLDRTGDAEGFDCKQHGPFKVAGTVFGDVRTKDAQPQQWEAALQKARARAGADKWPVIQTYDF